MKFYDLSKGGVGIVSPVWLKMRWDQIEATYSAVRQESFVGTRNSTELRQGLTTAARQFNPSFNIPHYDLPTEPRETEIISRLLPSLFGLALQAKSWLGFLPRLQEGEEGHVILWKSQVLSLLANAFLSTLPIQKANFSSLLTGNPLEIQRRQEKLKCFLQYFESIISGATQDALISYERRRVFERIDWQSVSRPLCDVHVLNARIEDNAVTSVMVDFANKHVGGGVLGRGSLQEEILFATFPELLACRLMMEPLGNDEAVFVTGVTKYSRYSGYAQTFQFAGEVPQPYPFTAQVAIIDAIPYSRENSGNQYRLEDVCRELKKCVAGFRISTRDTNPLGLSSGAWGCGDFGGNIHLKFLIQWAAASHAGRPFLNMCLPGNSNKLREQVQQLADLYQRQPVSTLFQDLRRYSKYRVHAGASSQSLYEYLCSNKQLHNSTQPISFPPVQQQQQHRHQVNHGPHTRKPHKTYSPSHHHNPRKQKKKKDACGIF